YKKISYTTATAVASIIGLFSIPWKTATDPTSLVQEFLGILGAIIGPVSGIMLVSYLVVHKLDIDLVDLYKEKSGKYYYNKGWELGSIGIFSSLSIIIIVSKYIPKISFIYDNAFVLGTIMGSLLYYIYAKITKFDQQYKLKEEVHSGDISD